MLSLAVLSLAIGQIDVAPPPAMCPDVLLAANSGRAAKLVATDMSAWRGPVIELQLASSAEETQGFGPIALVRLSGEIYVGGVLGRRVDEQGRYSFALSFEPEQLTALAAATSLELVARDGASLPIALTPVDAAPMQSCLAANDAPAAPSGDPLTRRNFTFVPLSPNQPLRLRYRGDPSFLYPSTALRDARQGSSRVAVTIGVSGRITECKVIASSGHEDLDAASCRAARTSVYLPETNAAGEPVEVKREQMMEWRLSD